MLSEILCQIGAMVVDAGTVQIAAVVLGLLGVGLAVRQSLWNFPVGLVQVTLTAWIFYDQRLYADMTLQSAYAVALVYGWWCWTHPASYGAHRTRLPVTCLSGTGRLVAVAIAGVGALLWGVGLAHFGADPLPYRDAFIGAFGLVAQALAAHKKLEVWFGWLVVNVVGVVVYWQVELYGFVGLYILYIVLAVAGWRAWRRSMMRASTVG
ncbi:nicotinamide mononucleotide transporter [Salinisphaera sp. USBA-960]|nr:nicotinamide mononucleotide transporter [Salifodinibacter halophilus]NNC26188.1 nicotinamide mononucleotide transporter [Salifodinibacter halophilus]